MRTPTHRERMSVRAHMRMRVPQAAVPMKIAVDVLVRGGAHVVRLRPSSAAVASSSEPLDDRRPEANQEDDRDHRDDPDDASVEAVPQQVSLAEREGHASMVPESEVWAP